LTSENFHIVAEELKKLNPEEKERLLEKIRVEVDETDAKIISLLIKRINLSNDIGSTKKSLNIPAYDAKREKEIEEKISSAIDDSRIEKSLKRIYERIIDESRAMQRAREK
jgi:chorismate mutase